MAGFDPDRQQTSQMVGLKVNCGTFDFSNGSQTADVPCTLARALGGMAMIDCVDTDVTQATVVGYKVGDVSDCKVTFIRGGGVIAEDARMSYLLVGY